MPTLKRSGWSAIPLIRVREEGVKHAVPRLSAQAILIDLDAFGKGLVRHLAPD
jgi:hypothetical protein